MNPGDVQPENEGPQAGLTEEELERLREEEWGVDLLCDGSVRLTRHQECRGSSLPRNAPTK